MNLINLLTEIPSTEAASPTVQDVMKNPGIIGTYWESLAPKLIGYGVQIVICLIVLFIGFKVINGICKVLTRSMDKHGTDKGVANFITSLVKYMLKFLLVMLLLSSFGLSGSIVAILGSAGLTVGLALQGSLSNFAGGVILVILKPFKVGDYIIDHTGGQEGTVSDITIFYTKILTIDNKMIYIPNGQLSNATLTNVSKMDERRVDLTFSVAYDSDLAKVKEVLRTVAMQETKVLTELDIDTYVDSLTDSSMKIGLRVWVKKSDYFAVKWALTENVKLGLDEAGIQIPFPQMDVHMR